jgi:hypothetical protein
MTSHANKTSGISRRWSVWMLVIVYCAGQAGCVQRRLTIRTNPPGALVYVDNRQIGTTPVSTSFTYYGVRDIRIVKDGYETLVVKSHIPTPWYEWFPLDFVSENLVPREIRDERLLDFQLAPQQLVAEEDLRRRADQLRTINQAQMISPLPNVPGGQSNMVPMLAPTRGPLPSFVPPGSPSESLPPPAGSAPGVNPVYPPGGANSPPSQPGYAPQPSYTPQPSYAPQPGYTPQPNYAPGNPVPGTTSPSAPYGSGVGQPGAAPPLHSLSQNFNGPR